MSGLTETKAKDKLNRSERRKRSVANASLFSLFPSFPSVQNQLCAGVCPARAHEKTSRCVSRTARFVFAGRGLSVSIQRNASAASNVQKECRSLTLGHSASLARSPPPLSHRGGSQRGQPLPPALDSVSPQTAGCQNRREKFRVSLTDQRPTSRNVLKHRTSVRRITRPINRSVRARTIRCRTATFA